MSEFLFDKYSRNLDEILNLIPNLERSGKRLYMCPLCRVLFSHESLDQSLENPLTIEHIPPKSVGGSEVVLTCKKCNNEHGSRFDSHLIEMLNLKKIALRKPGGKKKTVRFKIGEDIISHGNLFISEAGEFNVVLEEGRTNPKYHEEIKAFVTGKMDNGKLDFALTSHNATKVKASILRAAYLKAFKELGYAFIFNANTEIPRRMIMNFEATSDSIKGVYSTSENNAELGLSIITKPKNLQGYVVALKIALDEVAEFYNVFLPGGNKQSINIYSELDKIKAKSTQSNQRSFQLTLLENEDFLSGENKYFALEWWGNDFIVHKGAAKK